LLALGGVQLLSSLPQSLLTTLNSVVLLLLLICRVIVLLLNLLPQSLQLLVLNPLFLRECLRLLDSILLLLGGVEVQQCFLVGPDG